MTDGGVGQHVKCGMFPVSSISALSDGSLGWLEFAGQLEGGMKV